jgi:bacteriocin biosynthesis cyclodehydratase domain-containing protein
VIVKLGVHELLLEGTNVIATLELLVPLLDGARKREEIIETFPSETRPQVDELLTMLIQRRFVSEDSEQFSPKFTADPLSSSFYWNFGPAASEVPTRLQTSKVLVIGNNLISRSLVRSLLEIGIGEVLLVGDPVLSNHLTPLNPPNQFDESSNGYLGEYRERFRLATQLPSRETLEKISLVCAASDLGEADALLEINRLALSARKPFLPVWLNDMMGYVGPLNFPFETACFRCYRLRVDSQDERYDVTRARRKFIAVEPALRETAGFLPPMAGVLGEIAAMEIAKCLGQFVPMDAVAAIIEMNLISFRSTIRRVLKIPRCPDCSDVMAHSQRTLTRRPQIPFKE